MTDSDLTRHEREVRLDVSRRDREFLEKVLTMARDGVREELSAHASELLEPEELRFEEAAYGRLLAALRGDPVVPDAETNGVLAVLAEMVDESNEYGRVVAEHGALRGMLGALGHPPACVH